MVQGPTPQNAEAATTPTAGATRHARANGTAASDRSSLRPPGRAPLYRELEARAEAQLQACWALSQAASCAVATLSQAGTGLQNGGADKTVKNTSLRGILGKEDGTTGEAARTLLSSCDELGESLVGLAAVLSGEVIGPLGKIHRGMEADVSRSLEEISQFKQYTAGKATVLGDCKKKKLRAHEELQAALQEQEAAAQGKRQSWFSRAGTEVVAAEVRVQEAAAMQTSIVEELAVCTDEWQHANMQMEKSLNEFHATLQCADQQRRRLLQSVLGRCAGAWEDMAHALLRTAEKLRACSLELERSKLGLLRRTADSGAEKTANAAEVNGASKDSVHAPDDLTNGKLCDEAQVLAKQWLDLEDSRTAWREAQEAREIQLLEREANLRQLQEDIEAEHMLLKERRKSLAMDQARSLAAIEEKMASPDRSERRQCAFTISDDSPLRFGIGRHPENHDFSPLNEEEGDEQADQMWDMDWTSLAPNHPVPTSKGGASLTCEANGHGVLGDDRIHHADVVQTKSF